MPSASATSDLMMSPCEHIRYTASAPCSASMRAFHSRTRVDRAGLHGAHGLAAGEDRGRGVLLDGLHQRLVGQLGELAAGPVAVVALADALVGVQRQLGAGGQQRREGLPAALQRAADDGGQRQRRRAGRAAPRPARRPRSSRATPGVQPASTPEVLAVDRPCRTRISVGMPASLSERRERRRPVRAALAGRGTPGSRNNARRDRGLRHLPGRAPHRAVPPTSPTRCDEARAAGTPSCGSGCTSRRRRSSTWSPRSSGCTRWRWRTR